MPLADLARVADGAQRVVTRIARGMIDRGQGSLPRQAVEATTLFLTGIRSGSTVLDIALPELGGDTLSAREMPASLGEMALAVLVESLEVLSEDEPEPVLPVGVDDGVIECMDQWLRALRGYRAVTVDSELSGRSRRAVLSPKSARERLRNAASQPSVPFVSADHQALTGRLYALNLRTGTFRIEDDARHSIRLTVPEDVRDDAAQLINTRVRAIGRASLDERRRLLSFDVAAFELLPDLVDQTAFFERHELVAPPRTITGDDLAQGVIPDLSDGDIDEFMSALASECG
jgi:hypothetical protein